MPTRRQRLTAALYRFAGVRITQAEIGRRFGIKQPAVSTRLARFAECGESARLEYDRREYGPPVRVVPMQLSCAVNI